MAVRLPIPAASFCPPALPNLSSPPPWVLVDRKAYIAKHENATTARGRSTGGDIVEVSFCLAEPPAISHLCICCPDLKGHKQGGFFGEPVVAAAEGPFVLLDVHFNFGPRAYSYNEGIHDLFVYTAGPTPRLQSLPDPFPRDIKPWEVGILPVGEGVGKGGFVVATLVWDIGCKRGTRQPYHLHLFESYTGEWRTVVPTLDPACEHRDKVVSHASSKVIAIGGGFLGWVDLWRGILLCNVLAKDPILYLIPLPKPMVARAWKSNPTLIRDVTSDGNNLLSFVEIQFPKGTFEDYPPSYWDMSVSDSDSDSDSDTEGFSYVSHGWRATTWKRKMFSDDRWINNCTVTSTDIISGDPTCFQLLPELWDAETGKLTLKNLDSSAPVVSVHDDGVVYMMSERMDTDGNEAWMAAFDVRRNRLKALAPFSSERISSFEKTCSPCSFSKYFCRPAVEEEMINQVRKFIERELQPLEFFVSILLSAQAQLSTFVKSLEDETQSRPSLHSIHSSSLHASIQAVFQFAPKDVQDEAICEAVEKCMRPLKDLESWIVFKANKRQFAPYDTLSDKIHVSLNAIDSLVQTLSSTVDTNSSGIDHEELESAGLGPQLDAISIC